MCTPTVACGRLENAVISGRAAAAGLTPLYIGRSSWPKSCAFFASSVAVGHFLLLLLPLIDERDEGDDATDQSGSGDSGATLKIVTVAVHESNERVCARARVNHCPFSV